MEDVHYIVTLLLKTMPSEQNIIWQKIKNNSLLLQDAIKVVKNKYNIDTLKAPYIAMAILLDYENVDPNIYNQLIDIIYSNVNIARYVVDNSNFGNSLLLMSLFNNNLKLTDEQKNFAVDEAMNKVGTVRYEQKLNEYVSKLKEKKISTLLIEKILLNHYIFSVINANQAHGVDFKDIRYYILRNSSWSFEEKQKLVNDFWFDDKEYSRYVKQWEQEIIKSLAIYRKTYFLPLIDSEDLYLWSYDVLLDFCKDKKVGDDILSSIVFCREMHKLRLVKSFKDNDKDYLSYIRTRC